MCLLVSQVFFSNSSCYFDTCTALFKNRKNTVQNIKTGKDFKVVVTATMSAGKSTLLNAMIGSKLLPSKNEACTSTLFCIEDHDDKASFSGRIPHSTAYNEWSPVNEMLLSDWNMLSSDTIQIRGDLPYIKNSSNNYRVIFYDTPGPNNSMNENHAAITKRILTMSGYSAILFVMNAELLEVNDDWSLLQQIKKNIALLKNNVEIIFVLNKMIF